MQATCMNYISQSIGQRAPIVKNITNTTHPFICLGNLHNIISKLQNEEKEIKIKVESTYIYQSVHYNINCSVIQKQHHEIIPEIYIDIQN